MNNKQLFLIGGKEDKGEKPFLLGEFYQQFNYIDGPLILITGASRIPLEIGVIYTNIFTRLGVMGVNDIIRLPLIRRSDCNLPENVKNLVRAFLRNLPK